MTQTKKTISGYDSSIWLCQSEIDITTGHQVLFADKGQQQQYFTSSDRAIRFNENRNIVNKSGVLTLTADYADIERKYNFLIFLNPNHENHLIICNIVDYQYSGERTTRIHYSVDNFQTYMFDIDYDFDSFIARRHYTKHEKDLIVNLPYEDLDRGKNIVNVMDTIHRLGADETYFVITLSTPIKKFTGEHTAIYNGYQDNSYVDDNDKLATFKYNASMLESCIVFIVNHTALLDLVRNVFNTPEHANKLVKISFIPFDTKNVQINDNVYLQATGRDSDNGKRKLFLPTPSVYRDEKTYNVYKTAKNYILDGIAGGNDILKNIVDLTVHDPKFTAQLQYFLKEPFTSVQVSDVTGNFSSYDYRVIKDPFTTDDKLRLQLFGSLGIIPSVSYRVAQPFRNGVTSTSREYHRTLHDVQNTIMSDPYMKYIIPNESLSIVSDYTSAFLQANQNQISQSKINAQTGFDMNVDNINSQARRGMAGASLQYNNGLLQRETDMANFNINQMVQQQNNTLGMIGGGINMVGNAIGNVAGGNIGGAVSGLVGGGASMAINNQQFQNSQGANSAMFNNSMSASMQISNNNLQHQQGTINDIKAQSLRNNSINHRMNMDTMNAKMLDIENTPNNVSAITGGTLTNVLWNRYNVNIRTQVIERSAIRRLSNYFATYGFLSNSYENLQEVINRFNTGLYIQTMNVDIRGKIPQSALLDIKNQFDNGITIWKSVQFYRRNDLLRDL